MKTLLFISSNKMLGQGLSAAIQSKSELGFLWAAQLNIKILLLVRPEQAVVRKVAVDTKNAGLADDFVFYDSSLTYLLAKLEAL